MASHRLLLTNLALFVIGVGVALSQTSVQDYLFSRSPHERLMNHFARFEKKVSREPEIRRALEGMIGSDLSANLQELSRRGTARLDDTTLLERARLMSAIYSRLSDRACAGIARGSLTENGRAEFELTLLKLEVGFVSRWMECLHKAMLAEARQTPVHTVTRGELAAAFEALAQKIGEDATVRVDAGLNKGASDAELSWAERTVYTVAPTLPEPHGTALLRMVTQEWETADTTSILPLVPEVR